MFGGQSIAMSTEPNYAEFSDPRLVALYDPLNALGADSDFFCDEAARLSARSIIDLGCGTGLLTLKLAELDHQMTGIEPSRAMLDVARNKPGAEQVKWIKGSYEKLAGLTADMVLMTSHVAQFFLEDKEWEKVLAAAHGALEPEGHLVFDVRALTDPPFEGWPTDDNRRRFENTDSGPVEWWFKLVDVKEQRVRYELHYLFRKSGEEVVSMNELRFRSQDEIRQSLTDAGFFVDNVYGDWDRSSVGSASPEMIFVAERC